MGYRRGDKVWTDKVSPDKLIMCLKCLYDSSGGSRLYFQIMIKK